MNNDDGSFHRLPVGCVSEGHHISLRNDPLADPKGDKNELVAPLVVQDVYDGPPRAADINRVYSIVEVASARQSTNDGTTLLLSVGPEWKAVMIHFPDDQYEVLIRSENDII